MAYNTGCQCSNEINLLMLFFTPSFYASWLAGTVKGAPCTLPGAPCLVHPAPPMAPQNERTEMGKKLLYSSYLTE